MFSFCCPSGNQSAAKSYVHIFRNTSLDHNKASPAEREGGRGRGRERERERGREREREGERERERGGRERGREGEIALQCLLKLVSVEMRQGARRYQWKNTQQSKKPSPPLSPPPPPPHPSPHPSPPLTSLKLDIRGATGQDTQEVECNSFY